MKPSRHIEHREQRNSEQRAPGAWLSNTLFVPGPLFASAWDSVSPQRYLLPGLLVVIMLSVAACSRAPAEMAQEPTVAITSATEMPTSAAPDEAPIAATEIPETAGEAPEETAEPAGTTAPQTVAQRIEAELERLAPGRMLFNPPETMTVGQTERVEVRITRELLGLDPPATDPLTEDLQGSGPPEIEPVQVGTFMRARLLGDNFTITPLNNAEQAVGRTGFTEWAWDVTPRRSGEQRLHLAVTVQLRAEGGVEAVRDFPVREKVVTVAVNPGYTLASLGRGYWPYLLGGLILATGTLVVVRRRVRGRTVAPAAPTREGLIPQSEETRTVGQLTSQEPADHPPTQPAGAQPTRTHPVIAGTPGELAPGMLVHNRYQLVQLIDRGGMGAVYAAIDQRLNSRVALKHLLVTGGQLDAAFAREAQILATLRHPALPRVTDYFQEEQSRFLVMEYFAGDNLADRLLQQAGPLPVAAVLAWADQILATLEYLHGHTPPVLHRDIKPQNLKLTPEGQVILLDFGLAKGALEQQTAADSVSSVFGYTAHYAPPEQIQGSGTEPRSDLYALAATLYHLLTSRRPPTALERIVAIQNELPDPLQPISAINPAVPAAVGEMLHRALSLKLSERPAGAAAMRAGL